MRHGRAKIHQDAIPEVLGNIAVKPMNHLNTSAMVGLHHVSQVFRVQMRSQRGCIDQVTEQYHEAAAFDDAMRDDYEPFFAFVRASGLRQAECITLRWSEVDFGTRQIAFTPQVAGLGPAFVDVSETKSVVRAGLNLRFGR